MVRLFSFTSFVLFHTDQLHNYRGCIPFINACTDFEPQSATSGKTLKIGISLKILLIFQKCFKLILMKDF